VGTTRRSVRSASSACDRRAQGLRRGQPLACFPGGRFVGLEDTIKGFKGLCEGEYDDLPEAAFYMVSTIESAVDKAKRMAAEAA